MGDGRDADIRVGDLERGQARAMLDVHLGHGRLSAAEHEERVGAAETARTRGELETLFRDLPAPHPDLHEVTRPATALNKATAGKPVKRAKPVDTPVSKAFEALAGVWVFTTLPAAIVLTVTLGLWWMFVVFAVGLVAFGSLNDATKRRPPQG